MQCVCPLGQTLFQYRVDKIRCRECLKGYYNDEIGATECRACPNGLTTIEVGTKDSAKCVVDPHYQIEMANLAASEAQNSLLILGSCTAIIGLLIPFFFLARYSYKNRAKSQVNILINNISMVFQAIETKPPRDPMRVTLEAVVGAKARESFKDDLNCLLGDGRFRKFNEHYSEDVFTDPYVGYSVLQFIVTCEHRSPVLIGSVKEESFNSLHELHAYYVKSLPWLIDAMEELDMQEEFEHLFAKKQNSLMRTQSGRVITRYQEGLDGLVSPAMELSEVPRMGNHDIDSKEITIEPCLNIRTSEGTTRGTLSEEQLKIKIKITRGTLSEEQQSLMRHTKYREAS